MARKQTRCSQISRIAILAATLAVALAAPLWAQKGKAAESAVSAVEREMRQTQGALDSIKAELNRGRIRLGELQKEEGNHESRLDQLEKNISFSGKYLELVQRQVDTTGKAIALLGDSLAKAEDNLFTARELMKRRLRSAYMTGEVSKLQMILTAKSPTELVYRVRFFQDLNRYDRRLAESIKGHIASVNDKRMSQEENKRSLEKLFADKKEEQRRLVDEETAKRAVLEDIRARRSAYAAMVAELEEAQRGLDAIMKMLEGRRKKAKEEDERRAAVSFEKRKGKLGWPVEGEVVSKFGRVVHPVYRTVTMNDGIDIAAKRGASVRSVAPGSVAYVNWMRGLGRFVIVDHSGGFFTLYARLGDVSVTADQDIVTGTEIGKVGEAGAAGSPRLHFQVRKTAELLNPEEWLE